MGDVSISRKAVISITRACLDGNTAFLALALKRELTSGAMEKRARRFAEAICENVAMDSCREFRGVAVFLGGGPAGGKAALAKALVLNADGSPAFAHLNSEGARDALGIYGRLHDTLREGANGSAAKEQAALGEQRLADAFAPYVRHMKWNIYKRCLGQGVPLLVETGMYKEKSVIEKSSWALNRRYQCILVAPYVPPEDVRAWAEWRSRVTGVPLDAGKLTKEQRDFDKNWGFYAEFFSAGFRFAAVDQKRRLVCRHQDGNLTIADQDLFNAMREGLPPRREDARQAPPNAVLTALMKRLELA